ncbi:MAG TPA: DUF5681 domain-containing protein [Flavisolibacter sp.]|nr:DUF5681 domain-containing protein [Flavisolibacter sp.]
MPFEPGKSGNPNGRPKGSLNKAAGNVRDNLASLLEENGNKLKTELDKLEGKDYVSAYTALLPYVVPKLQNTTLDIDLEQLTDEQLDDLYNRIMEAANK